ncbi:O-antigen ligase domain-containing protein [Erythrobacteraceae bacterium CFH 75059]|uniref:O-antigen ligase family protein n=1 Tax=Qipengyuania thermophila TaxID=2509361 RepID=UPI0010208182|nr:O-antigen ligase family protein [Qipengyuania thermophila]TCD06727.1 O-antigen ligase domain-containing protein [Erythrobacteraceae bacterium CFH 75059]
MDSSSGSMREAGSPLAFWLLAALLTVLLLAGGASRADVLGQPVVRFFAWGVLGALILFSVRVRLPRSAPALLLGATIALVALQLVPLPPALWTALPGRDLLAQSALVAGLEQPWRPLSMSPGGTANALGSLIVPAAVLLLAEQLDRDQHRRIAGVLLGLVVAGGLIALLQVSGARWDSPFVNDMRGEVSGSFANRNHFALFLAMGCVLAPVWGLRADDSRHFRAVAAIGLIPVFLLLVFASGSRAGLVLGFAGAVAGLAIARKQVRTLAARLPRRLLVPVVGIIVAAIVGVLVLSVLSGRAVSVDRALTLASADDLRNRFLPVVVQMTQFYLPAGTGFGTFDPVFRVTEPEAMLQPQYINQAHSDWLQITLEGGVAGAALLLAGAAWWGVATWRALKARPARLLPLAGSALILLVAAASLIDYPARTPLVMGVLMLAAVWLSGSTRRLDDTP